MIQQLFVCLQKTDVDNMWFQEEEYTTLAFKFSTHILGAAFSEQLTSSEVT